MSARLIRQHALAGDWADAAIGERCRHHRGAFAVRLDRAELEVEVEGVLRI